MQFIKSILLEFKCAQSLTLKHMHKIHQHTQTCSLTITHTILSSSLWDFYCLSLLSIMLVMPVEVNKGNRIRFYRFLKHITAFVGPQAKVTELRIYFTEYDLSKDV